MNMLYLDNSIDIGIDWETYSAVRKTGQYIRLKHAKQQGKKMMKMPSMKASWLPCQLPARGGRPSWKILNDKY